MVVKTTIELPAELAKELKELAKASDLNRPQYVRRVLEAAAAKRTIFESVPSERVGFELMAAEERPPYDTTPSAQSGGGR